MERETRKELEESKTKTDELQNVLQSLLLNDNLQKMAAACVQEINDADEEDATNSRRGGSSWFQSHFFVVSESVRGRTSQIFSLSTKVSRIPLYPVTKSNQS